MLIIISPSKTLDEQEYGNSIPFTTPHFLDKTERLISKLQKLSKRKLKGLMGISDKLAELNVERYAGFSTPLTLDNAKQAIFLFKGDVYEGLQVESFKQDQIDYAQNHLRILSGLYGLLRPLDLTYPYRLEMGIKLPVRRAKNLYQYWGEELTNELNKILEPGQILVNLASQEYAKAINFSKIKARIITPAFREEKDGEFKMISFFAKKARGLLSRFILVNKITTIDELIKFNLEGYEYNPQLSKSDAPVFTRMSD